ncbi:hypothetical protein AUQ48_06470 [Kocuria flava]|uniref:Major facilitator superfamily (MFS) profile domain-containing protein n=1 Tax=Kocuria flava TaxID=446860 RepID=A0A2N4T130_9MICC|nr:hypothetical protein [Kocuria flava]PLC11942.1 hypothetical protein AUQ48_06470 [Kocuria flava]
MVTLVLMGGATTLIGLLPTYESAGVSISYAIGAILGGAFAPMIAQALLDATGGTPAIAVYLIGMCAVALVAVSLTRNRTGIDLSIGNQAERRSGARSSTSARCRPRSAHRTVPRLRRPPPALSRAILAS